MEIDIFHTRYQPTTMKFITKTAAYSVVMDQVYTKICYIITKSRTAFSDDIIKIIFSEKRYTEVFSNLC